MTEIYEHIRNRYCHEVLKALYQNSDGVARASTYGKMLDGKLGQLFSNRVFFNLDLSELYKKLNITDVLLQEVCEYLELNNHIESAGKTDKGVFQKIRFTSSGVTAYKTNYYLKENKKITDDRWIRRSTLFNNLTTPFIALAALVVAINQCNSEKCDKGSNTIQIIQRQKEQVSSGSQPLKATQPTNSSDVIPKTIKTDSLAKTSN